MSDKEKMSGQELSGGITDLFRKQSILRRFGDRPVYDSNPPERIAGLELLHDREPRRAIRSYCNTVDFYKSLFATHSLVGKFKAACLSLGAPLSALYHVLDYTSSVGRAFEGQEECHQKDIAYERKRDEEARKPPPTKEELEAMKQNCRAWALKNGIPYP